MKKNKFINWEKDSRNATYERDFKEIIRNIVHNELHIKRLMTAEGVKEFGQDAMKEISITEQLILRQRSELEFLKQQIENEK